MTYKLWSEDSKAVLDKLTPDLGLRGWNDLDIHERGRIWKYMHGYFSGDEADVRKYISIYALNERHKYNAYGKNFLEYQNEKSAGIDFEQLITGTTSDENVVYELISIFGKIILNERRDANPDWRSGETDEERIERTKEWRHAKFDEFSNRLNEVFSDFGLNVTLTRNGLIPRQEKQITENIYKPVIALLGNKKWSEVNRELSSAFDGFRKGTPEGYSECVTHSINSIESFLQITVNEEIGKGTLTPLLKEALKKGLIPADSFTEYSSNAFQQIFARARMDFGNAHTKKEHANEKQALLVMNLTMVTLQHFINK